MLAKGQIIRITIKCPRCRSLNTLSASSAKPQGMDLPCRQTPSSRGLAVSAVWPTS
ncbi:Com family DNA-binding transcriptional regulator [Paludibacterium paludis]|nr:Com family DNA-binding transcriptional regulator [Paludibacterium paludis]